MTINDISPQVRLFNKLQQSLQRAAIDELKYKYSMIHHDDHNKDAARTQYLSNIAIIELRDYMEQFIYELNIHNAYLFLGKQIRNFADAAYIISELNVLITAQLKVNDYQSALPIFTNLINCCEELINRRSLYIEKRPINKPGDES